MARNGLPASALPPKLEAVLVRLCRSARLNKTQAVKLPYLVDVIASHVLGRPITEGSHEAWQHGVVTSEVWRHLDEGDGAPSCFALEAVPFSEEKRVLVDPAASDDALTSEEQRIVDYVAQELAGIAARALGDMTQLMNPGIVTWGGNGRADLGPDAYERMSDEYQEMAADAANLSLDELRRTSRRITAAEEALA